MNQNDCNVYIRTDGSNITDRHLANEIVLRLNHLMDQDPKIKEAITKLLAACVRVYDPRQVLRDHPTIQVRVDADNDHSVTVGIMGLLNGLVGVFVVEGGNTCGRVAYTARPDGEVVNFVVSAE